MRSTVRIISRGAVLLSLMLLMMAASFIPYIDAAPPSLDAASQPTSQPSKSIDESLVKKLLGGQSTTLNTVESTLDQMDRAAERLQDSLDPGLETQQSQRHVVEGIDQLIDQARRNRVNGQKQQAAQRAGDRREGARRPQSGQQKGNAGDPGRSAQGGQGAARDSSKRATSAPSLDKSELSRGWGYLPLRDRQEISQGFDDEFPGKYREEIIRYYRDLAKSGQQEKEP